MSYTFVNPQLGMPPIGAVVTDGATTQPQQWKLGDIAQAYDSSSNLTGEFIYLKGVLSTVPKAWVTYNPLDYTTKLLLANDIGPVAVAMGTTIGSTTGWYQISGVVSAKASTSYADNGNVYATATSGVVDDAVVAGDLVLNAKGAGAEAAGSGYTNFEIARPYIMDRVGTTPGSGSSVNNG